MTTDGGSDDWSARTARAFGTRVRQVREANGLSVQAVADRCTALGYKMLRTTLANLEAGARRGVTVAELAVVARALEVPPLALLVPLDEPHPVEVLPGVVQQPWMANAWFTGRDQDLEFFGGEPSMNEANDRYGQARHAYSELDRHIGDWELYQRTLDAVWARSTPDTAARAVEVERWREQAVYMVRFAVQNVERLGLPLPPIPPDLESAVRAADAGESGA